MWTVNVVCKHLAHDGDQWRSVVETVMNSGSIKRRGISFRWLNFCYLLKTDSSSRDNLLRCHG